MKLELWDRVRGDCKAGGIKFRNHFEWRAKDAAGELDHTNTSTRARLGIPLIPLYLVNLRRILNHDIGFRNSNRNWDKHLMKNLCELNTHYELEWRMGSCKDTLAREYVCNSNKYDFIIIEILESWIKDKFSKKGHSNHERETLNH